MKVLTPEHVVEAYTEALAITRKMLEAAQAGEWEALVELEQSREKIVTELIAVEGSVAGSAELRGKKRELIQAIMSCDEEIRVLTQDWMRELRHILVSVNNTEKLNKTYKKG